MLASAFAFTSLPDAHRAARTHRHRLTAALIASTALMLAACGGGGGGAAEGSRETSLARTPPATLATVATPASAPYLRMVVVNPAHAQASDAGPGNSLAPYKTIGAALRALRPGDDIVIAAGTYREALMVPSLAGAAVPTRLRAALARSVLIKGSAEVTGWGLLSPGVYAVPWVGEEPQQVYRNGQPLKQIGGTVFGGYPTASPAGLAAAHANDGGIWPGRLAGGLAELVDDSFTYDATNARLVVRTAKPLASTQALEVSVLRHVLRAENVSALTVEGLDFAHANTSATYRQGAVLMMGNNSQFRDIAVRDMDGACVQIGGTDMALLDSVIEGCGQTGLTGRGLRLTIEGNRITRGNLRGFNKWWEAGGMKLTGVGGLHDSVIRNNNVSYNHGDGIWVDWKNTGNLIEGNTTAYNAGFGVHYEASQTGTIRNNLVYGNEQRGIYLLESSSTVVQGNAVFGNAMEGIAVLDGDRSAADATLRPANNRVLSNAMAWNDDERNWVQLVLPGLHYGSASERNAFTANRLAPRMSLGFVSPRNPAFDRLETWRGAAQLDLISTAQTVAMPETIRDALKSRRVLMLSELPTFLAIPGIQ